MSWLAFMFPRAAVRRVMRRHAATPLGMVREHAIAKVAGAIEPIDALVRAPIADVDCAMYHLRIDAAAVGDVGWFPLLRHSEGAAFWIADDTGRAVVEPQGSEVALESEVDWSAQLPDERRRPLERLLRRHGIQFTGWAQIEPVKFPAYHDGGRIARALRVRETVVPAGRQLQLVGRPSVEAVRDPRVSHDYRGTPTALVFRAGGRYPLLIGEPGRG